MATNPWGVLPTSPNDLPTREHAKTRQDDFIDTALIARSASQSNDGPVDRIEEPGLVKQSRNLARQERTEIAGSIPNFVNDLGSTVNKGDDVL